MLNLFMPQVQPSARPRSATSELPLHLLPASAIQSTSSYRVIAEQFDKAAIEVKKLKSLPGDNDLLELYALFKQATVGDADPANRPGFLDLKGKAKFDAWHKKSGTSKEDAQKAYIAKVEGLVASIGLQ